MFGPNHELRNNRALATRSHSSLCIRLIGASTFSYTLGTTDGRGGYIWSTDACLDHVSGSLLVGSTRRPGNSPEVRSLTTFIARSLARRFIDLCER